MYDETQEAPLVRTVQRGKSERLRPARAFVTAGRPGIDDVARRGARCFLVDSQRLYAAIEVLPDHLTEEGAQRLRLLTGRKPESMAFTIWQSCLLSCEGKLERLEAMEIPLVFTALNDPWEGKDEKGWNHA